MSLKAASRGVMSVAAVLMLSGVVLAQPAQQPAPAPAPAPASDCEKKLEDAMRRLAALEERNRQLSKDNDELRRRVGEGGSRPAPRETTPTGGSSTSGALASPESMFDALASEYQVKFGSRGRDSRSEQNKLQADVRAWTREAARGMTGPVDWTIEVVENRATPGARAADVRFRVLGASKDGAASPPATAPIPTRFAKDLAAGKTYRLRGTVTARPAFNANRTERGASDEPRFIGAYAEFGYELVVASLDEAAKPK